MSSVRRRGRCARRPAGRTSSTPAGQVAASVLTDLVAHDDGLALRGATGELLHIAEACRVDRKDRDRRRVAGHFERDGLGADRGDVKARRTDTEVDEVVDGHCHVILGPDPRNWHDSSIAGSVQ